jgi:hypothetical protein
MVAKNILDALEMIIGFLAIIILFAPWIILAMVF